ncbi:conserved hypothetical protein [Clavispora lusitaniae ATCC 42720]|uniref:Uncharacterized protein n=1 Tax=Clavispora lusitaniae (strain ATCC 42720) TaxID=306902 RepID=C4Y4B2_CLAL4|nr:uncharacterized protein CLUG_02484 [Clavispora lusitaniae ATCC 42720]EEQ38357.1 conserved hypothetical protein [Clavispora lusitaniae ATCC 42720]
MEGMTLSCFMLLFCEPADSGFDPGTVSCVMSSPSDGVSNKESEGGCRGVHVEDIEAARNHQGRIIVIIFIHFAYLSRERQRDTQLVDRFSQLQGIEGSTETQSHAWSQFLRVRHSSQTGVSNLSLDEGGSIQLVLGGKLDVDSRGLNRIPSGLSTSLNQWGNLVVVSGSEDRQVGGGSNTNSVQWVSVTNTNRVLVELGGSNVVAQFSTCSEAIVSHSQVSCGDWALEQVEEQSGVDSRLLVEEVQLGVLGTVWNHRGVQFTLQAWGQQLRQFNLGVQDIGVVPASGQSQTSSLVSVLGVDRSGNGVVLGSLTLNGEGNTVWCGRLDINSSRGQVEKVLVQQVIGRLLDVRKCNWSHCMRFEEELFRRKAVEG